MAQMIFLLILQIRIRRRGAIIEFFCALFGFSFLIIIIIIINNKCRTFINIFVFFFLFSRDTLYIIYKQIEVENKYILYDIFVF
jgi:hypothetical protein